jgi:hypothetical protein
MASLRDEFTGMASLRDEFTGVAPLRDDFEGPREGELRKTDTRRPIQ